MVLKMVGKYLEKLLISEERHEGLLEIGSILVLAILLSALCDLDSAWKLTEHAQSASADV